MNSARTAPESLSCRGPTSATSTPRDSPIHKAESFGGTGRPSNLTTLPPPNLAPPAVATATPGTSCSAACCTSRSWPVLAAAGTPFPHMRGGRVRRGTVLRGRVVRSESVLVGPDWCRCSTAGGAVAEQAAVEVGELMLDGVTERTGASGRMGPRPAGAEWRSTDLQPLLTIGGSHRKDFDGEFPGSERPSKKVRREGTVVILPRPKVPAGSPVAVSPAMKLRTGPPVVVFLSTEVRAERAVGLLLATRVRPDPGSGMRRPTKIRTDPASGMCVRGTSGRGLRSYGHTGGEGEDLGGVASAAGREGAERREREGGR
jgi:hypothetical protein